MLYEETKPIEVRVYRRKGEYILQTESGIAWIAPFRNKSALQVVLWLDCSSYHEVSQRQAKRLINILNSQFKLKWRLTA